MNNHTFLIISRRGNDFDVTPVECDPHTVQGQQALKDELNKVANGRNVENVIDCGKQG